MLKLFLICYLEKKCGQNEVFKEIGSDCRTCNNLHPINCDVRKEPRCYCKEGYVRDSNGFCIHADDCQNNGEVFAKNSKFDIFFN